MLKKLKKIVDARLPTEIVEEFEGLDLIDVGNKKIFEIANENIIKKDTRAKSGGYFFAGFSFLFFIFLYSTSPPTERFFSSPGIYIYSGLILIFLASLAYSFFIPKKMIILDRKNGVFTFPHTITGKHYVTPFNKVIFFWKSAVGTSGVSPTQLLAQHPDAKIGGSYLMAHVTWYLGILSFYVWYMDKNRPLPPGTAFDPYRQQDFERRKKEGFPKPLYKSHIPTPEATPEQQKERERIGGW